MADSSADSDADWEINTTMRQTAAFRPAFWIPVADVKNGFGVTKEDICSW